MFTSLVEKLGESDHPPFDFAVIDEAQDVGVAQCDSSLPSGARAPTGSSSPAILVSESSRSRFPGKLLVWMSGDGTDVWVANYYSARNPLRLSSLVILGVVARMFRCATRSSCWCT